MWTTPPSARSQARAVGGEPLGDKCMGHQPALYILAIRTATTASTRQGHLSTSTWSYYITSHYLTLHYVALHYITTTTVQHEYAIHTSRLPWVSRERDSARLASSAGGTLGSICSGRRELAPWRFTSASARKLLRPEDRNLVHAEHGVIQHIYAGGERCEAAPRWHNNDDPVSVALAKHITKQERECACCGSVFKKGIAFALRSPSLFIHLNMVLL